MFNGAYLLLFFFVLLLSVVKRTNEKYSLASHYSSEFDQAAVLSLLAVYLHVCGVLKFLSLTSSNTKFLNCRPLLNIVVLTCNKLVGQLRKVTMEQITLF